MVSPGQLAQSDEITSAAGAVERHGGQPTIERQLARIADGLEERNRLIHIGQEGALRNAAAADARSAEVIELIRSGDRMLADTIQAPASLSAPYRVDDGDRRLLHSAGGRFRKRADVLVHRFAHPFIVATEHGDMRGDAGDWLVTNDPAVDPTSDVWPVSAERFAATYQPVEEAADPGDQLASDVVIGLIASLTNPAGQGDNREATLAIRKLREAQLWLEESERNT